MPTFSVTLTMTAFVEGTLTVRADDSDQAADEALKRLGEILWQYQGLQGDPPLSIAVESPTSESPS
jgi:hypothetical protein